MRHRNSSLLRDGTARARRNKVEVRLSLSDEALLVLHNQCRKRSLTENQALGRAVEQALRSDTFAALLDQFAAQWKADA